MTFVFSHLASLGVLVVVLYASGWLIERATSGLPDVPCGRTALRIAAGSVGWVYSLFLLATVRGYRPAVVLPLVAAVTCAALFWAGPLRVVRRIRELASDLPRIGFALLAALLPGLVLAALCARASTLTVGWDDDVYHLVLPKLYLQHRGFVRVPFNVYSHWPHNVELLFGLAMMMFDYVLAKLVHTLYLALTVLALYRMCRDGCSRIVAVLATLLVLGNDVVLYEAAVANIDIAFAFYLLVAIACADAYLRTGSRRALVWSGVFCGALAGTKLSGLAGVACVAGVLVARAPFRLRELSTWREYATCLAAPTLILAVPWYLKSYLYTGNPLYPLFFRQLGGIEWSEQVHKQFFEWQSEMGMGRTLRDYLLLPIRVITDSAYDWEHFDGYIGKFWMFAVPLAVLASVKVERCRTPLIAAALYFVFWALSSQQLRFLIAALPLFAIATAFAIEALVARLASPAVRTVASIVALLATVAAAWPMLQPKLEEARHEAAAIAVRVPATRVPPIEPGFAFLNANTPTDARVLLLNENRGFFLDRAYIADSFPEASQLSWYLGQARNEFELREKLDALAVTHVYFTPGRRRRIVLPEALMPLLENPDYARQVFTCRRKACAIYELRRAR